MLSSCSDKAILNALHRVVASTLPILLGLLLLFPGVGRSAEVGDAVWAALEAEPRVAVVIALRGGPAPTAPLPARQIAIAELQQRVLQRVSVGPTSVRRFKALRALGVEVTREELANLAASPDVRRIDLDVGGGAAMVESLPLIRGDAVQALGHDGAGVSVAVIDTGIDTNHPDFRGRLVAEHCFCRQAAGTGCCPNGELEADGPGSAEDDNGHGTNVAGILAGGGAVAPRGLAPAAGIVAIKVLDSQSRFGRTTEIVAALDWLITEGPPVAAVNLSLGTDARYAGDCDTEAAWTLAFQEAIAALRRVGTVVVACAMNNSDTERLAVPACIAEAISVGAVYDSEVGPSSALGCSDLVTAADRVTCFSNASDALDLLAPGAPIRSSGRGGGQSTYFGTSQASPQVAGVAVLLRTAAPGATTAVIENALVSSGVPVLDHRTGRRHPRLDAWAALSMLMGPLEDDAEREPELGKDAADDLTPDIEDGLAEHDSELMAETDGSDALDETDTGTMTDSESSTATDSESGPGSGGGQGCGCATVAGSGYAGYGFWLLNLLYRLRSQRR